MSAPLYPANKAPLQPSRFIKLPVGAIAAKGWLETQLKLEADGFIGHLDELSAFVKKEGNAWLDPKGAGQKGWEEVPYWLKGYADLAYLLRDKRMIAESKVWIEGVFASQREDGWFGPESNLKALNGKPDLWPNMIMLNVLQSYHEYTGDKRVLDLMTRYSHWQLGIPDSDFLIPYWQYHRAGDNLASVIWLYNRTGDAKLVELMRKIHRCGADWSTKVPDSHGVNFAQAFRRPATYWLLSKVPDDLQATRDRYDDIRKAYGQVPGGLWGADENARPGFGDPRQAAETCTMAEMMLSCEMLARDTGDLFWADLCEDVAFNDLPASMTPDLKSLRYLTAPNQVRSDKGNKSPGVQNSGPMFHFDPYSHRCCQHNVSHAWPYFAESLWAATPDGGVAAMLYAPCEVKAKVGRGRVVRFRVDTHYPFEEAVKVRLSMVEKETFPIQLRIPSWCKDPKVTVNGERLPLSVEDGFGCVEREWSPNDTLILTLPMETRVDRWPGNHDSASISRGPLTYSVKIDQETVRNGGTDKWPAYEILPRGPWNYALELDDLNVEVVKRPWPKNGQPFDWNVSPIELRVSARKVEGWKEDRLGLVGLLRNSRVKTDAPVERIALVPMGVTRLRISQFPVVGQGPDAEPWIVPGRDGEPSASHCFDYDQVEAITDGIVGRSSSDASVPKHTFWNHKGTQEWVQLEYTKPRETSSVAVYWYDDLSIGGGCAVPESWSVSVRVDGQWRKVADGPAPKMDAFNRVSFGKVVCDAVRVDIQLKKDFSAGVKELRVE